MVIKRFSYYLLSFFCSLDVRICRFIWACLFTLHHNAQNIKHFINSLGWRWLCDIFLCTNKLKCCATHHRIWSSMFWSTGRDIIVLKDLCLLFVLCADKIGMKHLSDIHWHTAFHRCLANIYANARRKQTSWEYLKSLQADLSQDNWIYIWSQNQPVLL